MVSVAKDHARQCQGREGSKEFNERETLMKNTGIKHMLVALHISAFPNSNMVNSDEAKVIHDMAEITLISYILKSVKRGAKFVCVFNDDTYVFTFLVYWIWKCKIAVDI